MRLPRAQTWAALAVFAALVPAFLARIHDQDLWFHLVAGREILRTHALPAAEFYVWPVMGEPARFHEWGFALLAAAVHGALGVRGLSALNAAVGAGTVAILVATAVRRGAPPAAALALAGPLALGIAYRIQYRPEIMLYLGMAATLYACERARSRPRWVLAVPALAFGLSLFHPSALVLLFLYGSSATDTVLEEGWRGRLRPAARTAGLVLLASAAAIALAPYGVDQLLRPFAMAAQRDLTGRLGEYQPTLSTALAPGFLALVAAAAAALALGPRRPSDLLSVGVLAALALRYVRGIPLLALAAYPVAAVALGRLLSRAPRALRAAIAAGSLAASVAFSVLSPFWGAGPVPGRFPERTAAFLEARWPAGPRAAVRILNPLHTGGYLAWRLYPRFVVAVDGHFWSTNAAWRLTDDVFGQPEGWDETLRRNDVSVIATPGVMASGAFVPLVAALGAEPGWQLAVVEPAGMLFVRTGLLSALGAPPLDKALVWRQVLDETAGVIASLGSSASPKVHLSRGVALFRLHDVPGAAAELGRYAALAPGDAEAAQLAAVLGAAARGDAAAAEQVEALYRSAR